MTTPSAPMQRRRERILAAAREIIAERGYDGLTMRELATAGRVTVPTVYNLIGGKEAVLFAAVEEQTARFVRAIESSRGVSPAGAALAVVNAAVRELLRLPRYYRTLLMLLFTSEAAETARRQVNRALREQFARAITELDASGQLDPWVDREVLADRLAAQLAVAALQWAAGASTAETFRGGALFDASTTLLAVTGGASQRELQRVAARAQRLAASRGRSRRRRGNGRRASGRST